MLSKAKLVCGIAIFINVLLLIIILFFKDRFLFFILGYDYQLTKSASDESFEAYKVVHPWRIVLLCLTLLAGIVCFYICWSFERKIDSWYYTIGKFVGLLSVILMIVILIAIIILPSGNLLQ